MKALSRRLSAIRDIVPRVDVVADIGCDHGYLSISLVEKGYVKRAIASDIVEGPLESAKKNIIAKGIKGIETRISDGLSAYEPSEADVFVIAGMGGDLILEILSAHPNVWEKSVLVLSPHTNVKRVREYILRYCHIDKEDMVYEDGKFYQIIRAVPKTCENIVKEKTSVDEEIALRFGPQLIEEKNEILIQYLIFQEEKYNKILLSLPEGKRRGEIKSELNFIKKCKELTECR